MEEDEKAEIPAAQELDRGAMPWCAVDEPAVLLLVDSGSRVPCQMVDLSLTGCRVRLGPRERLPGHGQLRIEATFKARGIAFRFAGVTESADAGKPVEVRFVGVIARRMDELIEVLCELEAAQAAKAEKEATEQRAAEERAQREAGEQPAKQAEAQLLAEPEGAAPPENQLKPAPEPVSALQLIKPVMGPFLVAAQSTAGFKGAASQPTALQPAGQAPAKQGKQERRAQSRHDVETSATIHLVNIRAAIQGRIVDLSAGGCRIRTEDTFPVGIYTRVEVEFRLQGLPFRLGGVIQAIHNRDRRLVGIRFLDVSDRKREQVEQLIHEIEEMEASREATGQADSGQEALKLKG